MDETCQSEAPLSVRSQMDDDFIYFRCAICHKLTTSLCDRCGAAGWCSPECAETDRELHESMCERFLAFTNSLPPPPDNSTLAFYFPKYDALPEPVWIQYSNAVDTPDGHQDPRPLLMPYLGTHRPSVTNICISRFRSAVLETRLKLYGEGQQRMEDLAPNRSVCGLNQDYPNYGGWLGSFVVLAVKDNIEKEKLDGEGPGVGATYINANLADYRTIVDIFRYGYEPLERQIMTPKSQLGAYNLVRGVRICCNAEMNFTGSAKFISARVPIDHPVWNNSPTCISDHVGFPLLVHKNECNPAWDADEDMYENIEASLITRIVDVDSDMWGTFQEGYEDRVGSVLVVRQDGLDLEIDKLRYFAAFCGDEGVGGFIDKILKSGEDIRERFTEDLICEEALEAFTDVWMENDRLSEN